MPHPVLSLEEQVAFFQENGYVILENAVAPSYLAQLQAATAALLADPRCQGTTRNLLAMNPVFEDMIDGHAGMPLLERLIPDLQLLAMDMRTCMPNAGNMGWHADIGFFCDQTVSVNTALYLDELTPDNGALRVLPGSHKTPFPLQGEAANGDLAGEVRVLCPAGTMVLFDDCLWHRTGANVTDRPRRGIFTYYGHYWMKPCNYEERPEPFHRMRQYIEGKGEKRSQLLGVYLKGSEFNHFEYHQAQRESAGA
jgi:ectoine hydroxylase-related dioxygenase (phytanoyl-CoA dioxygenase family)